MKFRIFTEPQQGASYDDQLAIAQATERLGFNAFFRSDHFLAMDAPNGGLPGPTDAWLTLAALARETSGIRLGTLVSSATFRHPGLLAVQVAQVDQMSGGRVEFALGTGWFAAEHAAYGVPFPRQRFGLLEEQLEVITGLWDTPLGERFDFTGSHYTLRDSPALPKPAQQHIPIIVGGTGAERTPRLAARFADEYNVPFSPIAETDAAFARVRAAVEEAGRDAGSMIYSTAITTAIGASESEYRRRAEAIGEDPAGFRAESLGGTVQEAVDKLGALADIGVETVYLQIMDMQDLEHLELIAAEVAPAFA
ncbi:LLM class F420-dependent oxidoreductase [Microterricola viridarii]|uniref:Probable F420-dependent oxidoreductase, Rv1855c family n=1 Tax=Microterricola viridarii TaxID=412690 RepID=A0A1H1Y2V4_9MICO|nr:LLM class F420-dependent oxidoreductase [Microterricola viridarii]SDT15316.1 probable F420-dependent oxidoreductase, Rv1855c family [Microterricola viridarii]